jgi:hypothetical protein
MVKRTIGKVVKIIVELFYHCLLLTIDISFDYSSADRLNLIDLKKFLQNVLFYA